MATKFMQISPRPLEPIPDAATPGLASFTVNAKSYLGRVAFMNEDGTYNEVGEGSKVVFLYEGPPPIPPGMKCTVFEFYRGLVPGAMVETQGKVVSTFTPGIGYVVHGINYDDVDVFTRGN